MGTSVYSGTATGVVVTTGVQTYFGSMATAITGERVQTSFDLGLNRFTWLMIQLMAPPAAVTNTVAASTRNPHLTLAERENQRSEGVQLCPVLSAQ